MYEAPDQGDSSDMAARRWRRVTPGRAAAVLAPVLGLVALVAFASSNTSRPEERVRAAAGDILSSTTSLAPLNVDGAATSSTSSTVSSSSDTTSTTAVVRASGGASTDSSTTSSSTSTTLAEPSWEIFLHDVSVSPAAVSPGQTITVSWRLVSEIGINQTFFYLSWPESSPGFPPPSDECPHFIVVPPVSGTDRDGTYRVTCTVPEDTPPTTYGVSFMARHHRHDPGDAQFFHDRAQFTVAPPSPSTTSTTTTSTTTTSTSAS